MDSERIVNLTTGPAFTWWVRHVASRLDPLIFRATNGRFTSMGPPVMPMLTMTTIGRRSGKPPRCAWRAFLTTATTWSSAARWVSGDTRRGAISSR